MLKSVKEKLTTKNILGVKLLQSFMIIQDILITIFLIKIALLKKHLN